MASSFAKKHPIVRRALRVALILLLLGAGAGFLVQHYLLDVDRYRLDVVRATKDFTGLPVSVGSLSLDLLPVPRITAYDVVVGEPGFQVSASRVVLEVRALPLLRRKVEIPSIVLEGLIAWLPASPADLTERINDLVAASEPSTGEPRFQVSIAAIDAKNGEVFVGVDDGHRGSLSFSLRNVLSNTIGLALTAQVPAFGDDVEFTYSMNVERVDRKVASLKGAGKFRDIEPDRVGPEGTPQGKLTADFFLEGSGLNDIKLNLSGTFDSASHEALNARFHAAATWSEDGLSLRDAAWISPGIEAHVDATVDRDGASMVQITQARANQDGLDALFDMVSGGRFVPQTVEGAEISGREIVLSYPAEGTPKVISGEVDFRGLRLANAQNEALVAEAHGRFTAEEGLIRIEEFESEALSLDGVLLPDLERPSLGLNLHGSVSIGRTQLAAFFDSDAFQDVEGTVSLERLVGTFGPGIGIPDDLGIEGSLDIARLILRTETYDMDFAPITSSFVTDSTGIRTILECASPDLGPITVDGRYAFDEKIWRGIASVDVVHVVEALLQEDRQAPIVSAMLDRYGASDFWIDVAFSGTNSEEMAIHVQREGSPTLEANIDLAFPRTGGFKLGRIDSESVFTLDGIGSEFFEDVETHGEVSVVFAHEPESETFHVLGDLSGASIRVGKYLEKKPGDRFKVSVSGSAGEVWATENFRIELLGESVPVQLREDGVVDAEVDLDLALLANLLPEGATAHGTIRARVVSEPLNVSVTFDEVGFAVDTEIEIDAINGVIELVDENLGIDTLTFRGDNTECVFSATRESGRWTGILKGKALDLDWLLAVIDAAGAMSRTEEHYAQARGLWANPLMAEFYIHFDKLYYRRGEMDAMTVRMVADDERIQFKDIYLRPYVGKVTGTIDITPAVEFDSLVTASLTVDKIDSRIIDEILFENSRDLRGILSGSLDMYAPLGSPKSMIAAANGGITWTATDGTLGKLGFATRLLTALKPVDIIMLRIPTLRDEGLTYKKLTGSVEVEDGVMRLQDVLLNGGGHNIEAKGIVNFAKEETNVSVNVRAFQGVANILKKVPIVRQVTKITTDLIGVTVKMRGSPYDLQTRILPGGISIGAGSVGRGKDVDESAADSEENTDPERDEP